MSWSPRVAQGLARFQMIVELDLNLNVVVVVGRLVASGFPLSPFYVYYILPLSLSNPLRIKKVVVLVVVVVVLPPPPRRQITNHLQSFCLRYIKLNVLVCLADYVDISRVGEGTFEGI